MQCHGKFRALIFWFYLEYIAGLLTDMPNSAYFAAVLAANTKPIKAISSASPPP